MKNITTSHFVSTVLSTLKNSQTSSVEWVKQIYVAEGIKIKSENRRYLVVQAGSLGLSKPIHTSGKVANGTAILYYIEETAPSKVLGSGVYIGVGGPTRWQAEPTANDAVLDDVQIIENTTAFLRVTPRDVALACKRVDWASGTVYDPYPAVSSYVMVGYAIYRCLSNAGGAPSTVSPSGNSIQPVETSDGYLWKYLGTFSESLNDQFSNASYFVVSQTVSDSETDRKLIESLAKTGSISGFEVMSSIGTFLDPVVAFHTSGGTGGNAKVTLNAQNEIAWIVATGTGQDYKTTDYITVHENGSVGSGATLTASVLAGGVSSVSVDNQGASYTTANVVIHGDGTGATATATVTGGFITGITVTNTGTGYTWASAAIIPGDSYAMAKVIPAPIGGHGKDVTKELPFNTIVFNRRISSLDDRYVEFKEYRQFSLVTGVTTDSPYTERMTGPAHTNPTGLVKADTSNIRILSLSNVDTVEHEASQDDDIRFYITLDD